MNVPLRVPCFAGSACNSGAWRIVKFGANEAKSAAPRLPVAARAKPDHGAIEAAARVLSKREPTLLVLAGRALRAETLELAGRIAAKTGCIVATQFFSSRIERGAGRVPAFRIPYAVEPALKALAGFKHIITVETNEPVAFFAYPNKPSLLKAEGCQVHGLCPAGADSLADGARRTGHCSRWRWHPRSRSTRQPPFARC